MTARRYRKKPVVVEAVQWTGTNVDEMTDFAGLDFAPVDPDNRADDPEITGSIRDYLHSTWIGVKTGQYVVRGVRGEYYPIDAGVLAETYDEVSS
jgi:hypothetical protein